MKSSAKKIELASVDDLFSTEEGRQDAKLEKIQEIPLSELHPFKNHPFKVKDDEAMMETADSIKQYGVLVPAIARPKAQAGCSGFVLGVRRRTGTDPSKDAAIRDREFERLSAENGAGWVCGQAGTAGAEGVGLPDAPKQQQLEPADPQSA